MGLPHFIQIAPFIIDYAIISAKARGSVLETIMVSLTRAGLCRGNKTAYTDRRYRLSRTGIPQIRKQKRSACERLQANATISTIVMLQREISGALFLYFFIS